ncbi:fluoride efflux transporter FluC [Ureibacillus chungkukjangi]|uniref:Fluoride-specific ion channel FluC n=1 Tax=Ureibacillus chungkukjangi TaxID=1202712 RepID=A0A318TLL0_9BACL|nr:CrcB family protein [Ureibacillus chungkukjangi]MCM3389260.1 CrcB family protein [Ureibacillus chungkukjangi]PYF03948.1 camphor resistance protein CrcB [Ureibacillus chungkukjangi]
MQNLIQVFLGGMLGSALRYLVQLYTNTSIMLWIVNILGSLILGSLNGYFLKNEKPSNLFLTTGMLGAFTTFSTFTGNWFSLLQENLLSGIVYGLVMTLLCFIAALLGYILNRGKQAWNG